MEDKMGMKEVKKSADLAAACGGPQIASTRPESRIHTDGAT
jgi:hypothetical protein